MTNMLKKLCILSTAFSCLTAVYGENVKKLWDVSLKQNEINRQEWQLNGSAKVTPDGIVTESGGKVNSEAILLKDFRIPRLADGKLMRIEWEYTPLRIGKYGQDFRIENGPVVMEVMSRRPFLNVSARASFDKSNNRRYKVSCDFFEDFIVSWKINGMEQLKEPVPAWKKSSGAKPARITLSDFPKSVSRTLWHRVALYEISNIDELKIKLLCIKQIQRRQKAEFLVGINSSMDKVPLDSLKYKGKLDDVVQVWAAGRERVSFQLALIPQNRKLEKVKIHISDFLTTDGKKRLPAKIAKSHLVGYVKLQDSRITDSKYGEYWPDAIMPMRTATIAKGLTQPYWFNITVPAGTAPGIYESIIHITSANGGERLLKLQLNVRNFDLPLKNTLVTAMAVNPGGLERCYNAAKSRRMYGASDAGAHDKMYNLHAGGALEGKDFWRPFYDMLLSYRINPVSIYSDILAGGDFRVVPAMEDMDYCYERGLNAACLMCLRKLPEDSVKKQEYLAEIKKHLDKWEKFVKKRNWPGFVWYIHAFDESEIHANTPERRKRSDQTIRETISFIKKHHPWVKIETANPYVKRNAAYFDIWTPRPFRMDEFVSTKATFWMYVCCGPQKPYANLFIDYPGTDPRVLPWQMFMSQTPVKGFLYYLMNREIYPEQWAKVKLPFPFVPVRTRWLDTNGDGQLLYPGPDKEIYPSTRLACFRDGLQDYEVFVLLRDLAGKVKKLPVSATNSKLLAEAEEILRFADSPVTSWTSYSVKPQDYTEYRKHVDQLIEKILALPGISARKVLVKNSK